MMMMLAQIIDCCGKFAHFGFKQSDSRNHPGHGLNGSEEIRMIFFLWL
jgi:hypothetical protein